MAGEPLPGEAWDDATLATEHARSGAGWRIRVLRWALRRACTDVLRLGGEGIVEPWVPQTADELADGYTEWAEARLATLLVGEVELEETHGGPGASPSGG